MSTAIAQVTAIAQTQLKQLPPGTTPPLHHPVQRIERAHHPAGPLRQRAERTATERLRLNFIRTQLVTVRGAAIPYPYGGKQRQVQVDLNLHELQAKGLSPSDVANTIANQNLILPSGTMKMGTYEYQVETNSAPTTIEGLNDLPIKPGEWRDGLHPRRRACARRLPPADQHRARGRPARRAAHHPEERQRLHAGHHQGHFQQAAFGHQLDRRPRLKITPLSDQSIFVRGAISGVVHEALIAACLTGFMILVFLGSWRSTLIIAVSIPLSILVSLILLGALGETINIMTLGGLALAVGILVDDATVEIENINRNLEEGKEHRTGHSRWRRADRGSGLCLHAFHLHRVRAHVLSGRRREVPLCAAGGGRRLRHARLLFSVANRGAHHGEVPAVGARSGGAQAEASGAAIRSSAFSLPSSAASSSSAVSIMACSDWPSRTARCF